MGDTDFFSHEISHDPFVHCIYNNRLFWSSEKTFFIRQAQYCVGTNCIHCRSVFAEGHLFCGQLNALLIWDKCLYCPIQNTTGCRGVGSRLCYDKVSDNKTMQYILINDGNDGFLLNGEDNFDNTVMIDRNWQFCLWLRVCEFTWKWSLTESLFKLLIKIHGFRITTNSKLVSSTEKEKNTIIFCILITKLFKSSLKYILLENIKYEICSRTKR